MQNIGILLVGLFFMYGSYKVIDSNASILFTKISNLGFLVGLSMVCFYMASFIGDVINQIVGLLAIVLFFYAFISLLFVKNTKYALIFMGFFKK